VVLGSPKEPMSSFVFESLFSSRSVIGALTGTRQWRSTLKFSVLNRRSGYGRTMAALKAPEAYAKMIDLAKRASGWCSPDVASALAQATVISPQEAL